MRIRSTKPEFFRSKRVASVPWADRFVLKALESYVDDNGVGKDDIALIATDCFPHDLTREPSRVLASLRDTLARLSEAGLLHRYEVENEHLLYIAFWESIQRIDRPAKGRLPRPDGTWHYRDSEIREPSCHPREPSRACLSGTGDQGTGDQGSGTSASAPAERDDEPDSEFDTWWKNYPRKKGKGQAVKAYKAARKTTSAETLLEAVKRQSPTLMSKGSEYCPYPATWLNGQRWEDEPERPQQAPIAPRQKRVNQWRYN